MGWTLTVPEMAGYSITIEIPHQALTFTRDQQLGEFTIIGRNYPVLVLGERSGLKGSLPIVCRTVAAYTALQTALNARMTLLIAAPTGESWYMAAGATSESWSPIGDATKPVRTVTVALTQVDAPEGP